MKGVNINTYVNVSHVPLLRFLQKKGKKELGSLNFLPPASLIGMWSQGKVMFRQIRGFRISSVCAESNLSFNCSSNVYEPRNLSRCLSSLVFSLKDKIYYIYF